MCQKYIFTVRQYFLFSLPYLVTVTWFCSSVLFSCLRCLDAYFLVTLICRLVCLVMLFQFFYFVWLWLVIWCSFAVVWKWTQHARYWKSTQAEEGEDDFNDAENCCAFYCFENISWLVLSFWRWHSFLFSTLRQNWLLLVVVTTHFFFCLFSRKWKYSVHNFQGNSHQILAVYVCKPQGFVNCVDSFVLL